MLPNGDKPPVSIDGLNIATSVGSRSLYPPDIAVVIFGAGPPLSMFRKTHNITVYIFFTKLFPLKIISLNYLK